MAVLAAGLLLASAAAFGEEPDVEVPRSDADGRAGEGSASGEGGAAQVVVDESANGDSAAADAEAGAAQAGTGRPSRSRFLSRDQIESVVRPAGPSVQACYDARLVETPVWEGRVELTWDIELSGEVGRAFVSNASSKADKFFGCLLEIVRSMKFPPPDGGMVVVTYPFTFRVASPPVEIQVGPRGH